MTPQTGNKRNTHHIFRRIQFIVNDNLSSQNIKYGQIGPHWITAEQICLVFITNEFAMSEKNQQTKNSCRQLPCCSQDTKFITYDRNNRRHKSISFPFYTSVLQDRNSSTTCRLSQTGYKFRGLS